MNTPLVSVIALCYNHERFVREAVESVLAQPYPAIEIILVDDASTDNSANEIRKLSDEHPNIQVVLLPENIGNCKAFNVGWRKAKGEFIIDFATDDVMLPDRIEKQVNHFQSLGPEYGVVFTDASYIDESGNLIRHHNEHLFRKGIIKQIPEGEIFRNVLQRYFISGPTMMVRMEVLQVLNGYDESLAYEDFDFWVRSSRIFKYGFLNERLTKVRKISRSMSVRWYQHGDQQLYSTYMICRKAKDLCRNEEDLQSLIIRTAYEFRQSLFSGNHLEAKLFQALLMELDAWKTREIILKVLSKVPIPWPRLRKLYHQLFYN